MRLEDGSTAVRCHKSKTDVYAKRSSSKIFYYYHRDWCVSLELCSKSPQGSGGTQTRMGPKPVPRACGFAYYLLTVFLCNSWHCRLHSCPSWVNNLADFSRHLLQGSRIKFLAMNSDGMFFSKELPAMVTHVLSRWVVDSEGVMRQSDDMR